MEIDIAEMGIHVFRVKDMQDYDTSDEIATAYCMKEKLHSRTQKS